MCDSENATTLPNVNGKPTRRTILKAGAALVTVSAAAVPALADPSIPNPDADLLKAWNEYIAIHKALREAPSTITDKEEEALFYKPMTALEDKIVAITAHTHTEYAVKARMAFYWSVTSSCNNGFELAAYHKGPLPDGETFDHQSLLLWQMVEQSERMEGAA